MTSTTYQATAFDSQVFLACGTSYFIGMIPEINATTAEPFYNGVQFTENTTPIFIQGIIPQLAGCIIGQITNSVTNETNILIAFRGTEFVEINDWSTDLMAEPYAAPEFTSSNASLNPMVHSGFYLSFMQLQPALLTELNSLLTSLGANTPIVITGHSKGGGMACLAAYYLVHNVPGISASQIIVETVAGPNPGNADFATAFAAVGLAQINFINYLDIVPWLPFTPDNVKKIQSEVSKNITDPLLLVLFKSVMNSCSAWNYAPTWTQLYFINEPSNNKDGSVAGYPVTKPMSMFEGVPLDDIGLCITSGSSGDQYPNFEAILAAHSHDCGGVYMLALCPPGFCPTANCPLMKPTVNAITNLEAANGDLISTVVSLTGNMPGTIFNWVNDTPGIGIAASGSGNLQNLYVVNKGTTPILATITVTPTYTYNETTMNGETTSFTITVNPSLS